MQRKCSHNGKKTQASQQATFNAVHYRSRVCRAQDLQQTAQRPSSVQREYREQIEAPLNQRADRSHRESAGQQHQEQTSGWPRQRAEKLPSRAQLLNLHYCAKGMDLNVENRSSEEANREKVTEFMKKSGKKRRNEPLQR